MALLSMLSPQPAQAGEPPRVDDVRLEPSPRDHTVGTVAVRPARRAHGCVTDRALRTGQLLFEIASDERLRNAKQLRKVTMGGDTVDLDVDERWSELPRLLHACAG